MCALGRKFSQQKLTCVFSLFWLLFVSLLFHHFTTLSGLFILFHSRLWLDSVDNPESGSIVWCRFLGDTIQQGQPPFGTIQIGIVLWTHARRWQFPVWQRSRRTAQKFARVPWRVRTGGIRSIYRCGTVCAVLVFYISVNYFNLAKRFCK